jgi:hypothetical protein
MKSESIYNMVRLVGENLVLMKRAASSTVVDIEWSNREGNSPSIRLGTKGVTSIGSP